MTGVPPIRVMIVEDHTVIRSGIHPAILVNMSEGEHERRRSTYGR